MERRGGFLMETGFGARVKAATSPTPFLRGAFSRLGVAFLGSRITAKMKIILFPVKLALDHFEIFTTP